MAQRCGPGYPTCRRTIGISVAWCAFLALSAHGQGPEFSLQPLAPSNLQVPSAMSNLGRKLFVDPRLSGDATVSCATCHDPEMAFTDGLPLSAGYPGSQYFRNTPTILNVTRQDYLYWDGRLAADDLPALIRDHISEAHFMQADGRLLIERMRQVPQYVQDFATAFGGEPTYGRILEAIAAYIRSLPTSELPLDRYLQGDADAISASAQRGKALFEGYAHCIDCHHGPMLTDNAFHDLGLPANPNIVDQPLRHITLRRFMRMMGVSEAVDLRVDMGRFPVTKQPEDEGKFRTPSLREVGRTAPYMHDGSLATLEDVLAFYNSSDGRRGRATNHAGHSLPEDPSLPEELSPAQVSDLLAFLRTLSSDPIPAVAVAPPPYELQAVGAAVGGTTTARGTPEPSITSEPTANTESDADHGFPPLGPLPKVPVPTDNPITDAKVELGRLLFFDARLSGDVGTSCASCHDGRLGWGDGNALSRGYAGTQHWRNSQTTINTAYLSKLFWAGEVTSLEAQADSATSGNVAGNGDPIMIEERLAQIPVYVRLFHDAFGTPRPTYELAMRAIASFERQEMIAADSPFDDYMAGDESALTEGALRGLGLFRGKANCVRCHNGPLLSDEQFHNLGVPQNELFNEDPLRQITLRFQHFSRGVPEPYYRAAQRDLGLFFTTKRIADIGRFRTPPLRYLEYTAPYMHNGVFETLEEVIDFYNEGGGDDENKSPFIEPLGLTDDEKFDLLEFLESLSGDEIRIVTPELPAYEVMLSSERPNS